VQKGQTSAAKGASKNSAIEKAFNGLSAEVYLRQDNGHWVASMTGDLNDSATEMVRIDLSDGSATPAVKIINDTRKKATQECKVNRGGVETYRGGAVCGSCRGKMKDRNEWGYADCNSAFYTRDTVRAAIGNTISAIVAAPLTLGLSLVLTPAAAASGDLDYNVSYDESAVIKAVEESKALDLARLATYQTRSQANSSALLQDFISRFEGTYDPKSLVAQAKEQLPAAIERDNAIALERAAKRAADEEARRQAAEAEKMRAEQQRAEELEALKKLQPGDRVLGFTEKSGIGGPRCLLGMIIEKKPPMVYVQWDKFTPNMLWVRIESLTLAENESIYCDRWGNKKQ
jgi:hypothetical protein